MTNAIRPVAGLGRSGPLRKFWPVAAEEQLGYTLSHGVGL